MEQKLSKHDILIEELRVAWQEKVMLYNQAIAERDAAKDEVAEYQAAKKAEKIKVDIDILERRGRALKISRQHPAK